VLSCFGSHDLQPPLQGSLQPVFHHFGQDVADRLWLAESAQVMIASMVCQIFWRFDLVFESWPFPLTQLVDVRMTRVDRDALLQRFSETPTTQAMRGTLLRVGFVVCFQVLQQRAKPFVLG
jgi:hypothetical protein